MMGLGVFLFWPAVRGRAIGIAMIFFGFSGLLVDYTSEHNARAYKYKIDKALKAENSI